MKVEFMVEDNAHYNSDMEYKIVESYYPDEYPHRGYDIYRVEADKLSDVHVIFANGTEYEAEEAIRFKDGNETVYYVSLWNPVA
jgi:hypothetical protein